VFSNSIRITFFFVGAQATHALLLSMTDGYFDAVLSVLIPWLSRVR
jgi:hypothetical protein